MASFREKRVLLGITGGIAAYKSCELARLLVKAGAEVRVVMTEAATRFVGPLSFQAITGHPVRSDLFDAAHEAAMGHIELARWADRLLVAPASADFLARLAHGLADDLLSTLCLASDAPLFVAPAMNQQMWRHPATADNLALLCSRGVQVIGPAQGDQACGDSGPGRMSEPQEIMNRLDAACYGTSFSGKRVMVTAGPTREPLDPVRFIGNRSSGKMGFALAEAFAREGAAVTLVSGPVALATPAGVERIDVETAQQMHDAVFASIANQDLFVACAAVADFRLQRPSAQKIKKSLDILELTLVRNPDILSLVAALENGPATVGFAAETEDLLENARRKLIDKKLDMIIANPVGKNLGFDMDSNAVQVIWHGGEKNLPLQGKRQLAGALVDLMHQHITTNRPGHRFSVNDGNGGGTTHSAEAGST